MSTSSARLCAGLLLVASRASAASGPALAAEAYLVVGAESGKVYLAHEADEVRGIASITKLMAALVVMDRELALDEGTVINRQDWRVALEGSRSRLELKWTYRNRDLLRAALISSDNRATSALGRAVGLSAEALVAAMNRRARRMKLRSTRFEGPVGIHHDNVSTAREVAAMVLAASRNRALSAAMRTPGFRMVPMRGYLKRWYRNTNPLVGSWKGGTFLASKTGYNSAAGYCLAAVVRLRHRGAFAVVILGTRSKYQRVRDLRRILDWLSRR
jgi:D-alanyl-D-alanine endopeptidase (penicillin-binding protein 7)